MYIILPQQLPVPKGLNGGILGVDFLVSEYDLSNTDVCTSKKSIWEAISDEREMESDPETGINLWQSWKKVLNKVH